MGISLDFNWQFKETNVLFFSFSFFLQCRQLLVHVSDESVWFIYKAFYGHLHEMTYGYKLIDTTPDAFDVSKKVANTFYCVV